MHALTPQSLADQQLALIRQASVARSHGLVVHSRIAQMLECIELGHLGTAKSIGEIVRKDFDALLNSLPDLNQTDAPALSAKHSPSPVRPMDF